MRASSTPALAAHYAERAPTHSVVPAMARQLWAQDRHVFAHSSMPVICSQLLAQASQTSAQARHVLRCAVEAISMKFADV